MNPTPLFFLLLFTLAAYGQQGQSFLDSRDGKKYKAVKIGNQIWMGENLNYNASGGKCYGEGGEVPIANNETDDNGDIIGEEIMITLSNDEIQANCNKYGRLYDWPTAMSLPSNCNKDSCSSQIQPKHKGICPSGWHIPNNYDWGDLLRFVDSNTGIKGPYDTDTKKPYYSETAGQYLKTNSDDWEPYEKEGLDTYGFSALPSGCKHYYSNGSFSFGSVGYSGHWWSTSELNSNSAYFWTMSYDWNGAGFDLHYKSNLKSVRCIKD